MAIVGTLLVRLSPFQQSPDRAPGPFHFYGDISIINITISCMKIHINIARLMSMHVQNIIIIIIPINSVSISNINRGCCRVCYRQQ